MVSSLIVISSDVSDHEGPSSANNDTILNYILFTDERPLWSETSELTFFFLLR